jgi:hypothetical protein
LQRLHQIGWTHNDVRLPNIIQNGRDWVLIDCEYASRIGQPYLRYPKLADDQLTAAQRAETCRTDRDLHQLADEIIRGIVRLDTSPVTENARRAAERLERGQLTLADLLEEDWVRAAR